MTTALDDNQKYIWKKLIQRIEDDDLILKICTDSKKTWFMPIRNPTDPNNNYDIGIHPDEFEGSDNNYTQQEELADFADSVKDIDILYLLFHEYGHVRSHRAMEIIRKDYRNKSYDYYNYLYILNNASSDEARNNIQYTSAKRMFNSQRAYCFIIKEEVRAWNLGKKAIEEKWPSYDQNNFNELRKKCLNKYWNDINTHL